MVLLKEFWSGEPDMGPFGRLSLEVAWSPKGPISGEPSKTLHHRHTEEL